MRLPCHLISSHQSLLQGSNGHLISVWKRDSFSLSIYKCIWLTLLTVLICRLNNGAWRYPYSWEQFGKSPSVVCGGCEWNEASWRKHQVFLKQFLWICSLCDKHTSSFLLSVNLFVLKIILPILPSIQTKRLSVFQFTLRHCHVSFCKWAICHVPFTQLYLDNSYQAWNYCCSSFQLDFIENKFSPLIIPLPSRHFVWKCYGLRLSSNGLVMEDEMTLDGAITSVSFDEALETVSVRYG